MVPGAGLSALMGPGRPDAETAHPLLLLLVTGYPLFFTLMFSWIGIVLSLPAVWFLLRRARAAGPVSRSAVLEPARWPGCRPLTY